MNEKDKRKIKKGCGLAIFYIIWYFCIPLILSKIWNGILAPKFGFDVLFSYWEMWATWFGYQLFTGKFKIDLSDKALKEEEEEE